MKNCPKCGAECADDVRYCPLCGAPLEVEDPAQDVEKETIIDKIEDAAEEVADGIKADAEELAAKLNAVSLTIATKANKESGAIYGSVTNIQIAEALEKAGYSVDRKIISVKENVKALGEYVAVARLHKEVAAEIKFSVVAE